LLLSVVAPCSSHWQHRSRLALGAALLEQGLVTQEQLQQLAASIAKQIGIPAGGGASTPASSKPPATARSGARQALAPPCSSVSRP
jgi:hypothetical protein